MPRITTRALFVLALASLSGCAGTPQFASFADVAAVEDATGVDVVTPTPDTGITAVQTPLSPTSTVAR